MKERVKHFLRRFGEGFAGVIRRYPVELGLLAACTLWLIVANERGWIWHEARTAWMLPLFALWALAVNMLVGHTKWRVLYWISWMPLVPLYCWPGLKGWMQTEAFPVTAFILAPLALLLSRRAADNDRFVDDALAYVRSAVVAALFANVALGLFEAILWSTAYIFGFHRSGWVDSVGFDAILVAELFLQPLLFLMICDRRMGVSTRRSRVPEVLVNYIVTPALMIYAAILSLYIVRIVFTWSLPEGGIAYMVLIFAVLMLLVRGVHPRLEKRFGLWFYRSFSLVMLPAAVLFWAGVARRVGEYGLTAPRVWLIVCGGLTTVATLLLLTRRTGRYYYLAAIAFVCFAVLAYIPSLRPRQLAVREQFCRAERTALTLDMLASDGRLMLDRFETDERLGGAYRRLYTALDYVADYDAERFERFGITMEQFRLALPSALFNRVVYGTDSDSYTPYETGYFSLSASASRSVGGVDRYRTLYADLLSWPRDSSAYYDFSADTLRLYLGDARPALEIAGPELLQRQLVGIGMEPDALNESLPAPLVDKLLVYTDDRVMILFSSMYFQRRDSVAVLTSVTVDAVLAK